MGHQDRAVLEGKLHAANAEAAIARRRQAELDADYYSAEPNSPAEEEALRLLETHMAATHEIKARVRQLEAELATATAGEPRRPEPGGSPPEEIVPDEAAAFLGGLVHGLLEVGVTPGSPAPQSPEAPAKLPLAQWVGKKLGTWQDAIDRPEAAEAMAQVAELVIWQQDVTQALHSIATGQPSRRWDELPPSIREDARLQKLAKAISDTRAELMRTQHYAKLLQESTDELRREGRKPLDEAGATIERLNAALRVWQHEVPEVLMAQLQGDVTASVEALAEARDIGAWQRYADMLRLLRAEWQRDKSYAAQRESSEERLNAFTAAYEKLSAEHERLVARQEIDLDNRRLLAGLLTRCVSYSLNKANGLATAATMSLVPLLIIAVITARATWLELLPSGLQLGLWVALIAIGGLWVLQIYCYDLLRAQLRGMQDRLKREGGGE